MQEHARRGTPPRARRILPTLEPVVVGSRKTGSAGYRFGVVLVGVTALVSAAFAGSPAQAAPGASASTVTSGRYIDPIFASSLAPVEHASYDPAYALNERQTLTVAGYGGSFTLSVGGDVTTALAPTAPAATVQAALRALPATDLDDVPGGDLVVTGGPGGYTGGKQYRIAFTSAEPEGGYPRIFVDGSSLTNVFGLPTNAAVQCDRCLDVYQPDEAVAPDGGRPVVVVLHGGSFVGGAKDAGAGDPTGARMEAWSVALAERGYVVVPINYTLADPNQFLPTTCDWDGAAAAPCPAAWYQAVANAQHDAQAAIRWLRLGAQPSASGGSDNPYRIDPNRLLVVGESAGAFAALNVLYKPDDPGTVGVTTGSSEVSGAASLAGMMVDTDQRAGAGPALLLTFTNDPLGEILGLDMYEQSRQIVARANTVGNLAELEGYCRRIVPPGAAEEHPVHLIPTDEDEFDDQVSRVSRFFSDHVVGAAVTDDPAPARWSATGTAVPFVARGGQSLYGDHTPVVGDFDGDAKTDVIWYGAGGECDTAWFGADHQTFFDPKEVFGTAYTAAVEIGNDYRPAVGDFDADGRADIAWYDPVNGAAELWYGEADRTFDKVFAGALPTGLGLTAGDFDGDGRSDLLISSSTLGGAIVTFGAARGSFVDGTVVGGMATGLTPVIGDFDGDDHDDVYWQGPSGNELWTGAARSGSVSVVRSPAPVSPGSPESPTPIVGDVDGDGSADLFWYVPGVTTAIWYGNGPAFVSGKTWTLAGFDAAGADFNGDGRFDVLLHSPVGADYLWLGTIDRLKGFAGKSAGVDVGAGFVPVAGRFGGSTAASGKPLNDVLWAPA